MFFAVFKNLKSSFSEDNMPVHAPDVFIENAIKVDKIIPFNTKKKTICMNENTSLYCSWIIVVHVHANAVSNVHPACHNIANGIKPGSYSKRLINMLRIAQKLYVCWGRKVIYVRCINCSYNNVAKGIRLLENAKLKSQSASRN